MRAMVLGTLYGFVQARQADLGCWGVCRQRDRGTQLRASLEGLPVRPHPHSRPLLQGMFRRAGLYLHPVQPLPLSYDGHMHGIPRMGLGRW